MKHSHCGGCGAPYTGLASPGHWPRTCAACGDTAYRNPLPVAVALLPVTDGNTTGLVVITRTIEPALGGLALPGGFIDHTEDWKHAVVRELREETGIEARPDDVRLGPVRRIFAGPRRLAHTLAARPDHPSTSSTRAIRAHAESPHQTPRADPRRSAGQALADALSSPDGHLLLFGLLPERPATALPPSAPTDETTGHTLLRAPAPLAFPLHTEAADAWFAGRYH
ncbi:NUDIX domain-containing protein [Streptomyces sp. NPDC006976]|uniref:NUDIX domain-containing protein n=1 Tax=unclassified Streptomyces TaxID=2593676 RepID=UPI0033FB25DF